MAFAEAQQRSVARRAGIRGEETLDTTNQGAAIPATNQCTTTLRIRPRRIKTYDQIARQVNERGIKKGSCKQLHMLQLQKREAELHDGA